LRTRIHSLDGLRAVAASLVVIHHLFASRSGTGVLSNFLSSATASGVDLFFVLSGVVLGPRYIREGRPMLVGDYFRRRAQRLWPPYVAAWLLAGLAIAVTTAWPTWWSTSAYLPTFNWGSWLGQLFIIDWWSTLFNFAWWSLDVEISFYVLLPLLIPIFRPIRSRPVILFAVLCGVAILSAVAYVPYEANTVSSSILPIPVLRHLLNYSACFTAGLVIASHEVSARSAYAAVLAGVVMTIAATVQPGINPHIGWAFLYFGIVATALNQVSPLATRLSADFLVWLGERSYSLFLTHFSVIVLTYWGVSLFVGTKGVAYYLATRSIAAVFSLLTAMVLFSFVECRFANGLVTANRFWPPTPSLKPSAASS
jgi:peptidoglycan/LPS O-acetylase OafA/YrhL